MSAYAVFTWDDGYDCLTNAQDVFTAAGANATLYVVSGQVGTGGLYITEAHIDDLYDAGWDVANHCSTHLNMTEQDDATNYALVADCQSWCLERGYTRGAEHFAYPYTVTNAAAKAQVVAAGMRTLRLCGNGQYLTSSTDLSAFYCSTYFDAATYDLDDHKAAIDYAAANGVGALFIGHHCGCDQTSLNISVADLSALIDYCEASGVRVVSLSEWYAARFPHASHGTGYYTPTSNAGTWVKGVHAYLP